MHDQIVICLLLLAIVFIALVYPYWYKQVKIHCWYKKLALKRHLANYDCLYRDIDGFALSQKERLSSNAIEYTYGEIDFIPFIALLSLVKPNKETIFYDLGSGTGKAVLACSMVFKVKKSCGIEIFHLLHQAALIQCNRMLDLPEYLAHVKCLHFINADFLHTDFSDATLVFVNATAFFGDTWKTISLCLKSLRPGTIIITTSKKLPEDVATVIKDTHVQMSWGRVRAYIQQRI